MNYLNKDKIASLLPFPDLIDALRIGFNQGGEVPLRHSHTIKTDTGGQNTLLLMPSWQQGDMLGVKMVMVCPENSNKNLPSVSSTYMLLDAQTGDVKATLDGDELTSRRTAAASALASSRLSAENATSMMMMGTGNLASYLIAAHASVRKLETIYLWGRNPDKADKLADLLRQKMPQKFVAVRNPQDYVHACDIISCATLANDPILKGQWLNPQKKQHIDLVGGYTPQMREADDDVVRHCDVYVDTFDGALAEAGDIITPINKNILSKDMICGDLYDLAKDGFEPVNASTSTMFKSVGTALEDLIAAKLAYSKSIL